MSIVPSESMVSEDAPSTSASANAKSAPGAARPELEDIEKPVKRKRRSTSHLKDVPDSLAIREMFKSEAERYAEDLDKSKPFSKNELEKHARILLEQLNQPERYLGFTMVLIGNFFWKRQFLALPFEKRLLLLPHCLKHAEGCPAEYDEFGLDCESCGACAIADYKVTAEKLGYKVLVAEGSPIVLKIIVAGYVDGILGVACLNVLEKAIDKVLIAGVPSYAVPLHSGDCKNTTMDEAWIWEVLEKYEPLESGETNSYVPVMRAADKLFTDNFDRLLPRARSKDPQKADSPIGKTEAVAYDWLANGGKRFRPFITLAAFDAATNGEGRKTAEATPEFSDAVGRVAMAIEAFHKASLVHDDIQDDDKFRYGRETLHREHGVGYAINVGDYLIGLGYRLLNSCAAEFGPDVAADITDRMASAHIKLCDGQGAEMGWAASPDWDMTPLDALQIYALKTSPAFEAALYSGLRMAGVADKYEELIPTFSRHLGVGFQILNDLKDWNGDEDNKLIAHQDALALRPTLLLALALKSASEEEKTAVQELLTGDETPAIRVGKLRRIFDAHDVFDKAEALVHKSRARAEALADDVEDEQLRRLLYFFVDSVLASEEDPKPKAVDTRVLMSLPLTSSS